tara:strand:- start:48 stop:206 length:159 start_codon:yes stop_codon:yes gene_type:complete
LPKNVASAVQFDAVPDRAVYDDDGGREIGGCKHPVQVEFIVAGRFGGSYDDW